MATKDHKQQVDRRMFILGSAAAGALAAQAQPAPPKAGPHRRSYDLNQKWLFGGKTRAGVSSPGFNDSQWRKIVLPHTNAILPWHSFDESAFQYVSAYRRHFRALPECGAARSRHVLFGNRRFRQGCGSGAAIRVQPRRGSWGRRPRRRPVATRRRRRAGRPVGLDGAPARRHGPDASLARPSVRGGESAG